MGGGGGVAFHNCGHRLAFGHVNDMRCLEKVHAFFVCLILFFSSHQQSFRYKGTGLRGLNQC